MECKIAGERIKEKSRQLFFAYGLRSVSMDDVARNCGMSKKSIYKYFDDKDTLVQAIVGELIQTHKHLLQVSRTLSKDAIEEVIKEVAEPYEIWATIQPSFFFELEKCFPHVWKLIETYKSELLIGIQLNLERGMQQEFYRNNIYSAFVAELRLHQLINFLQHRFITTKKWSTHQSVMEYTILYLLSITTEKGKNRLYTHFKNI